MNIYIVLAILLANAVAMAIVYQFLKRLDKKEKIIFMAVSVAIMYALIVLIYWISGFGIDKNIHEACKEFVTYMFVPVNTIICIPYIASKYVKYRKKEIKLIELQRKIVIISFVPYININW